MGLEVEEKETNTYAALGFLGEQSGRNDYGNGVDSDDEGGLPFKQLADCLDMKKGGTSKLR